MRQQGPRAPRGARPDRRRRAAARLATALAAVAALALCACTGGGSGHSSHPSASSRSGTAPSETGSSGPSASSTPGTAPRRPNIVFVLTDDLSTNLIKYMPHVRALEQAGMSFSRYTVTDSLCCPSRASIFTGDYPHNTQVRGNTAPDGGFAKFTSRNEDRNTFATSLSAAGYRTGFIGKYLNGYTPGKPVGYHAPLLKGSYVPPGWDMWNAVGGGGYSGYNYGMAYGRTMRVYGSKPADYFTTVAQQRAVDFLRQSAGATPFMLEVATFAPHDPFVPAPQDVGTFAGLKAPHSPAFDTKPKNPPLWLADHAQLDANSFHVIDRAFERRVESVQAVDRMIGALQKTLVETGEASNTVFVFSSDNGFHLGEYTLRGGKQTPYDIDIRVPLVVSGPGIPAGATSDVMAENIDLRATFDDLAGVSTPSDVDGRSLLPVLLGQHPSWRTLALVEHVRDTYKPEDPDHQNRYAGVPPTYNAIRGPEFLYVRYADGDREYYDLRDDPYEIDNLGHELSKARTAELDSMLDRLVTCHGGEQCWAAGVPAGT